MNTRLRLPLFTAFLLLLIVRAEAPADWNQEWEKTLQAAKKEGQVTVYDLKPP